MPFDLYIDWVTVNISTDLKKKTRENEWLTKTSQAKLNRVDLHSR